MHETNTYQWSVSGKTVTGNIHTLVNKVNQDAVGWLPEKGESLPIILVVSDGHGSAKYFRSDRGAQFAVETLKLVLAEELQKICPDFPNAFSPEIQERLCKSIVQTWRSMVDVDILNEPILETEYAKLHAEEGSTATQTIFRNTVLAYGATVVAVVVTQTCAMYVQLGDGNILIIAEDGIVSSPFEKDTRLFGNETTSLCSNYAWRDIQISLQAFTTNPPALILLSTDGYVNSFSTTDAFHKVGSDILEMIRENGWQYVIETLPTWLNDATLNGSGDDISVGLLYRVARAEANVHEYEEEVKENAESSDTVLTQLSLDDYVETNLFA